MIEISRTAQRATEDALVSIIARNIFGQDAAPVLRELRAAAGSDVATLARVCGEVGGFFLSKKTSVLCHALMTDIDGAAEHAERGQLRRERSLRAEPAEPGNLSTLSDGRTGADHL